MWIRITLLVRCQPFAEKQSRCDRGNKKKNTHWENMQNSTESRHNPGINLGDPQAVQQKTKAVPRESSIYTPTRKQHLTIVFCSTWLKSVSLFVISSLKPGYVLNSVLLLWEFQQCFDSSINWMINDLCNDDYSIIAFHLLFQITPLFRTPVASHQPIHLTSAFSPLSSSTFYYFHDTHMFYTKPATYINTNWFPSPSL